MGEILKSNAKNSSYFGENHSAPLSGGGSTFGGEGWGVEGQRHSIGHASTPEGKKAPKKASGHRAGAVALVETTSLKWIANTLRMGTWTHVSHLLHHQSKRNGHKIGNTKD